MMKITGELIEEVTGKARTASRKRANHCFHDGDPDRIQRMLSVLEPGTYTRPHKHRDPDKREVFLIMRGKVAALEFNDEGDVIDHVIMTPGEGNLGVEFPAKTWHALVALEKDSVVYEIKDGPYDKKTDKVFAEWAPEEGSDKAGEYIKKLTDLIKG